MRLKIFASLLLTLALSSTALAEQNIDGKGYVGGLFGLSQPDLDGASSRAGWGLVAGAKLSTEFGLGAYYFGSSKTETINSLSVDFDYSLLGIEAAYYFEGSAAGTYLGARVGLTTVKEKSTLGDVSTNPYHFGLIAGYNYFFSPMFSVGGEASFYSVAKDNDGGVEIKGFNIVGLMLSGKFWF